MHSGLKGLQVTREGGERFGQRESRETGERDTQGAPRSNTQFLEMKNRTAGAEVGIWQSEARSELLLCTPCLYPVFCFSIVSKHPL